MLKFFSRLRQLEAPWLGAHRIYLERLSQAGERLGTCVDALNATLLETADIDIRFVPQGALPDDEAYEAFIARTRCVPTRENPHDFFNGLMWLRYPLIKRRMNALQAQEIGRLGTSGARGPLRDALTVFDENAALMQAPPVLVDALRRRDWRALFVTHRAHWREARVELFGHALMEKLMQPRKPITAHVWLVDEWSDCAIAASLTPERLSAKPFLPLPVLGVPGWWPDNESPDFYEDVAVFRPARQ
jgi:hypothetical protein